MAPGVPSTSAIQTPSGRMSGRIPLAIRAISASVNGTKPQFPDHASLNMSRMTASSSR